MAISVRVLLPAFRYFTLSIGFLILRRIIAVLKIIVSTNPSRLPRITLSFSGSSVFLAGYVRRSIIIALSGNLSQKNAVHPLITIRITLSIESVVSASAAGTCFSTKSSAARSPEPKSFTEIICVSSF